MNLLRDAPHAEEEPQEEVEDAPQVDHDERAPADELEAESLDVGVAVASSVVVSGLDAAGGGVSPMGVMNW